jgi:hypothetical protein
MYGYSSLIQGENQISEIGAHVNIAMAFCSFHYRTGTQHASPSAS